jgi:hypothetical protein
MDPRFDQSAQIRICEYVKILMGGTPACIATPVKRMKRALRNVGIGIGIAIGIGHRDR